MNIPDNFVFTADQAAMLASCCRETIINHTEPSKKGTRYFIPSRRNTPTAPIKIMAVDLYNYLQQTQRGYLPSNEQQ